MKCLKVFILVLLALFISQVAYSESVKVFDRAGVPQGLNISEDGKLGIHVEYSSELAGDFYLYKTIAIPVISIAAVINDLVINVVSSTGVVAGHVITIYEGNNMFQSIVVSTTATTITIASPIDFAYTAASLIEAGLWSMNVDGSSTTQIFSIKAPPTAGLDIHTINISMLDSSAMDDGLFGGITALSGEEGLLFRFRNDITKNFAVVVNNMGFWEIGFSLDYSVKAPAGQYGLRARRSISRINGVTVYIASGGQAELQIHVRADQTDLDLMACTVNGHIVKD